MIPFWFDNQQEIIHLFCINGLPHYPPPSHKPPHSRSGSPRWEASAPPWVSVYRSAASLPAHSSTRFDRNKERVSAVNGYFHCVTKQLLFIKDLHESIKICQLMKKKCSIAHILHFNVWTCHRQWWTQQQNLVWTFRSWLGEVKPFFFSSHYSLFPLTLWQLWWISAVRFMWLSFFVGRWAQLLLLFFGQLRFWSS